MCQKGYSKLEFDSFMTVDFENDQEDVLKADTVLPRPLEATVAGFPAGLGKDLSIITTRDYYGLAHTIGGNHSCLIIITNRSKTTELRDPAVYAKRGYNRIPPDAKILPESNAYCAFRKPSIAIKGTSGVLSYEYDRRNGRSKRLAVMWKVPYRMIQNEGDNAVALKWMEVDLEDAAATAHTCSELYREMSTCDVAGNDTVARQAAKNGRYLRTVNPDDGAELAATFSANCKAIVKVDFSFM